MKPKWKTNLTLAARFHTGVRAFTGTPTDFAKIAAALDAPRADASRVTSATMEGSKAMDLPKEHYNSQVSELNLKQERDARNNTLADLIILIETLEAERHHLKAELKAERELRAEIAADLRKISEQFNKLIAS